MNEFIEIEYNNNDSQSIQLRSQLKPKKSVRKRKYQESQKGKKKYHWTKAEQKKYLTFLIRSEQLFELSQAQKKKIGLHRKMSRSIATRDPQQCRSHHQKMVAKHLTIANIIVQLQIQLKVDRFSFPHAKNIIQESVQIKQSAQSKQCQVKQSQVFNQNEYGCQSNHLLLQGTTIYGEMLYSLQHLNELV